MSEIMDFLIVIGAILAFSVACSVTRKGFSTNIFLSAIPIAISVLVWKGSLPFLALVMAIILIILMLIRDTSDDEEVEG
jgi:asparagine N-glycosylation enzyme membrane subunit Stt3